MPTVTIVIPARNAASTIARTVESVLAQTFTDWEAVIVDDGSVDETAAVAGAAAGDDPRIRILQGENTGVSAARNRALASAVTPWVLFLDADDTIAPGHIAALMNAARRNERADVIYCDWRMVSPEGHASGRRRVDVTLDPLGVFARQCAFVIHAAVTRRTLLEQIGGFDATLRVCEDWMVWQRLAEAGAVFRRCPDTVADYRLTPSGASSDLSANLAAALRIIRRGHALLPDAPPTARAWAETGFLFWMLGRAVAAGRDAVRLFADSDAAIAMTFDAPTAASLIADGMMQGLSDPMPDWSSAWPTLRPRVRAALDHVAPRFAMPNFAALALHRIERGLTLGLPADADAQIGAVAVRSYRCGDPAAGFALAQGTERLMGVVTDGNGVIGRFELAPTGDLSAEDIQTLVGQFSPGDAWVPPAGSKAADGPSALEATYWEDLFATEDPWSYDNPYESLKYQQTLDAIPDGLDKALELACAEGHFTRRLAGKVGSLIATDISPTAVERAARRCADVANVTFGVLDMLRDPMPEGMDLIVCSEVLYYIEDIDQLALAADRMAAALRPGGYLVATHANLTSDTEEPSDIGFDWGHRFGARTFGQVFGRVPDLEWCEERRSDLYRIQIFRRQQKPAAMSSPMIRRIGHAKEFPADVAAHIDWRGRPPDGITVTTTGVPVLMYHRITTDPVPSLARYATTPAAFAQQMEWLSGNGYTAIDTETFAEALWEGTSLPERAVVITLDDGFKDNCEHALPVLTALGFRATIFIPTDHVGSASVWDRHFGQPAPLMSWHELEKIVASGLTLASHGASHRPMPSLTAGELADEAARSREMLRSRLGVETTCLAYPYGMHDEAVERALLAAGYRLAFTTEDKRWQPGAKAMAIPRIEVPGGMDLTAFAARIRAK